MNMCPGQTKNKTIKMTYDRFAKGQKTKDYYRAICFTETQSGRYFENGP